MAATLTETVVKEMSSLSRERGQERLLECLGWKLVDSEDDLQKSIQFDFLYNNLEFCIHKGFAPVEICHLFQLSCDLLNCAQRGKQMTSALSIYKAKCTELQAHVQQKTMKSFSEYFFLTFMKNYKMYEYVTEEPRDRQSTQLVLPVNTPPATLPLSQGKEAAVWNYLEKLSHLEAKERQQVLEREVEREETKMQDRRAIDDAYEKLNQLAAKSDTEIQDSLNNLKRTNQVLKTPILAVLEIINNAAGAHISELSHSLQFKIQTAVEDLKFKLEQNSLPRPKQMGPPPQFATVGPKAKINSSRSEKREARKPVDKK